MIQICRKDKEKVFEAIRIGKIDAAEMSFPNLIDDIILTMEFRWYFQKWNGDSNKICLWMELLEKSHGKLDCILCRKI